MREYELTVLYHPDLESNLDVAEGKVTSLITDNGGKINNTVAEGKKRLAYPIQKLDSAVYKFYEVSLPGAAINKISAVLNITPEVLRYLLVASDEKLVAARAKKEEE
ncbi:30S ribosomal protein S6 [Candidatus Saccharibacteria bacterium]|nr:30S ribosomal protein S6 [Candidatus Saccharibacteria bacterium]